MLEDSYHVATLDNDAPLIFEGSLEFVRRLAPATVGHMSARMSRRERRATSPGQRAAGAVVRPAGDVETHLVDGLLDRLRDAGVAAYSAPTLGRQRARTATRCSPVGPSDSVYVDAIHARPGAQP